MALTRAVTAAVLAAVALAGCTSDPEPPDEAPPTPATDESSSGSSPVGAVAHVILPPATDLDSAALDRLATEVARLAPQVEPEVRQVRVHRPDAPAFVGDLATVLADRGADLVCVVGPAGPSIVERLAPLHPRVRFCTAPTQPADEAAGSADDGSTSERNGSGTDRPGPITVPVRAGELGHALGVLAADAARGAPVGVLLGGDELGGTRFRDGLLAGLGGASVVAFDVAEDAPLTDVLEDLRAADVEVVVLDGSLGASEVAEALAPDVRLLAPASIGRLPEVRPAVVATWELRWSGLLRAAVDVLLGEVASAPSSGFAQDAFAIGLGEAAAAAASTTLERVVAELVDGSRDPFTPVRPPPPTTDTPTGDPPATEEGEPGSSGADGASAGADG